MQKFPEKHHCIRIINISLVSKNKTTKNYMCLAKMFDIYPVGNEKPSEIILSASDKKLSVS